MYLDGEYRVRDGSTDAYWRNKLFSSFDGADVRECFKTSINNTWIDVNSNGIPGRDYIQYHHVRINTLPTRSRINGGLRAKRVNKLCRAGYNVVETTTHVI